ncbi:MAG: redoxin domain-containing protein [Pikeienuella sp.]
MRSFFILTATFLLSFATPTFAGQSGHGNHGKSIEIGTAGPLKAGAAQIIGARFLDVDGNIRRLGDENGSGAAAFVFVDNECPVSARYLGEMNDFAAAAHREGVDFYVVLSHPHRNWDDARALRDQYKLNMPMLLDPSGDLASRLGPLFMGEAFVVSGDDRMIYRGRIDDRFAGIGQLRRNIRNHDLLDVLATAQNPGQPRATGAVGCFFEAWGEKELANVTYARDIEPILAANCVECHQTGGVAPFPLRTYDQSADRSGMLEYVTQEKLMPPWRPVPQHGRFRDERYLSDHQIALFSAWSNNDEAKGNPTDAGPKVKLPDPGWRMGKPDLVLQLQEPFSVPATGEDVYRYFVIPSGMTQDRAIVGIDFRPGATAVVHHANFFVDYAGKGRRMDAKDSTPGFSVFGTGGFMSYDDADDAGYGIGGWAPGAEPYAIPPGAAIWMPAGGDIVIEIHYKLNGEAHQDQSQIGFYFADKEPDEWVDGLLIGTQDVDIAAGDDAYTRHISMDVPVSFRLLDLLPHMHYIGSKARMIVTFPDGRKQSVFGIEDWDLRWQNIYLLREPLAIPAGSRIDAWFVWDNSEDNFDNPHDPPRQMKWGWKSDEEMAEIWMGVLIDNPDRRSELIEASNQTWYYSDSKPLP